MIAELDLVLESRLAAQNKECVPPLRVFDNIIEGTSNDKRRYNKYVETGCESSPQYGNDRPELVCLSSDYSPNFDRSMCVHDYANKDKTSPNIPDLILQTQVQLKYVSSPNWYSINPFETHLHQCQNDISNKDNLKPITKCKYF